MIRFIENIVVDTDNHDLFARMTPIKSGVILRMRMCIEGGIVESNTFIKKEELPLPQEEWEDILFDLSVEAIYQHQDRALEVCFPV